MVCYSQTHRYQLKIDFPIIGDVARLVLLGLLMLRGFEALPGNDGEGELQKVPWPEHLQCVAICKYTLSV